MTSVQPIRERVCPHPQWFKREVDGEINLFYVSSHNFLFDLSRHVAPNFILYLCPPPNQIGYQKADLKNRRKTECFHTGLVCRIFYKSLGKTNSVSF